MAPHPHRARRTSDRRAASLFVLSGALLCLALWRLSATESGTSEARAARPEPGPVAVESSARYPRRDLEPRLLNDSLVDAHGFDRRRSSPSAASPSEEAATTLATGHVTDDLGRPVEGARVTIAVPEVRAGGRWSIWRAIDALSVETAADGSFSIEGELEAERIALAATHPAHMAGRRVETMIGSRNLLLRLATAGRIQGELLLDAAASATPFVVSARPVAPGSSSYRGSVEEDGGFAVEGLAPGPYEVTVALEHEPSTAVVFDQVHVHAERTTWLEPADLRGFVSTFRIHARGSDGRLPESLFVRRRPPGEPHFGARAQPALRGTAVVSTLHPWLDLLLESARYRPELLEGVSTDREVRLTPSPTIRIVLRGLPPATQHGLWFGVLVEAVGHAAAPYGRLCAVDERAVAEVPIDRPGPYDVRVQAWARDGEGRSRLLSDRVEARLEIPPDFAASSFAIDLSAETLARLATASPRTAWTSGTR